MRQNLDQDRVAIQVTRAGLAWGLGVMGAVVALLVLGTRRIDHEHQA